MKTVLRLIAKEYALFLNDKVAVSLTFLVPAILITLWGSMFGNLSSGPRNIRLAYLNESDSTIGRSLENVLDTTSTFRMIKTYMDEEGREIPFDSASIKDFVRRGSAAAALVVPADAMSDTALGLKLKFYYDPKNEMEMQVIQGVLTQSIMSQMPDLFMKGLQKRAFRYLGADSGKAFNEAIAGTVSKYFNIDARSVFSGLGDSSFSFMSRDTGVRTDFFKNVLDLQSEQLVGAEIANPSATRNVGGWAMMFLLFSLTASAASLFEEKQNGVVLRLLASPISRVHILWGKYLFNMSLGLLQLVVLFSVGAFLFHIDVLSNVLNLLLIIAAASTACTAFGMLLAAVSTTAAQARGLGTLLILTMSSIGGAWFPTSFMPEIVQAISKLTIVYWSMDGFLQVLWRKAPLMDILPNLGILFALAALITAISAWRFKKGHVF